MDKSGLLIRLIDIVLIILLGFLTISDFSLKTQIKLPTGGNDEKKYEEKIITVRIIDRQTYYIEEEGDDIRMVRELKTLETHLANRKEENRNKSTRLIVVVEPFIETEIQLTVDVLDICERLKIDKTISYPNITSL
ncbi:biopolymer transporter ExbD [candidate division KSB1 bacterium]|nr:biopolymer transporter ExbD [candidate division KSB1 bacterium]